MSPALRLIPNNRLGQCYLSIYFDFIPNYDDIYRSETNKSNCNHNNTNCGRADGDQSNFYCVTVWPVIASCHLLPFEVVEKSVNRVVQIEGP